VDKDHNSLFLEDVKAEEPSPFGEDDGLEIALPDKDESHSSGSGIHPKEGDNAIHIAAERGRRTLELLANPTSRKNSVGQTLSRSLPRGWCLNSPRA
jgi:hypothetical protein